MSHDPGPTQIPGLVLSVRPAVTEIGLISTTQVLKSQVLKLEIQMGLKPALEIWPKNEHDL